MEKEWKLNKELIQRVQNSIEQTWQIIGDDCWEHCDDNFDCLEMCVDAGRIAFHTKDTEAQEIISKVIKTYRYIPTLKFLSKHIKVY